MFRTARRDRGFHTTIVLLLGVGIGANALVFSLVNELLLKPLPVRDPHSLVLLQRVSPTNVRPDPYFLYTHFRDAVAKSMTAVGEQAIDAQSLVAMREGDGVKLVSAQIVTPNYFAELGVNALFGRVLTPTDETAAVVSYRFWQAQFGGDRTVLGRALRLKEQTFTIVGVLPREFHSVDVDRSPDVRLPIAAATLFGGLEGVRFFILARLAPSVSAGQAAAELTATLQAIPDWSYRKGDVWTLELTSMERGISRLREQFAGALWLLLGGVALLLCGVCANVAGLLVAKSGERRREFAIRAALGAGQGRILRQILAENLGLAAAGAVLGGVLAWALAPHLIRLLPAVRDYGQLASPQLLTVGVDWRVLLYIAAATMFCVLASGLAPAWRASRVDLARQMHRYSRVGSVAPVAIQAAFCVVLLTAAGLMLRSYWKLDALDAGFDREHVVEFTFDPAGGDASRFYRDLRGQAATLPGVRAAAWSSRGVMRGVGIKTTVAPTGVVLPKTTFLNTSIHSVSPGYFDAVGIPLLAGRDLRAADAEAKPAPVVVNQALAEMLYPRQDPIGRFVVQGWDGTVAPSRAIVGVVPTAKYRSMREPDPPTLYEAIDERQSATASNILYVRTHGAPSAVMGAVRQLAARLDPGVALTEVATLDSEIRTSMWQERLVAILSAFFGAVAATLAGIGLYGGLSLAVAQRRKELGIRVAVGAQARHVAEAVCASMAAALGAGALAGLILGAWLLRLTRTLLFGVEAFDPVSAVVAVAVLAAGALLAAIGPVRRAARVDPAMVLREE